MTGVLVSRLLASCFISGMAGKVEVRGQKSPTLLGSSVCGDVVDGALHAFVGPPLLLPPLSPPWLVAAGEPATQKRAALSSTGENKLAPPAARLAAPTRTCNLDRTETSF